MPKLTPLEYMLTDMNDNNAEVSRRDWMAVSAPPYVHGKIAPRVLKAQRNEEAARRR